MTVSSRKKRRNPHLSAFLMNVAHFIICVGIVICAVVIFMNPTQFAWLFPVVFVLAALMQFLHGIPKIISYRRSHTASISLLLSGVGLSALGIILAGIAAASFVTVWG